MSYSHLRKKILAPPLVLRNIKLQLRSYIVTGFELPTGDKLCQ